MNASNGDLALINFGFNWFLRLRENPTGGIKCLTRFGFGENMPTFLFEKLRNE
jgi:hypothetical protein